MDSRKLLTHKHPLTLVPRPGLAECRACSLHIKDEQVYHCKSCGDVNYHKECVTCFSEITHPYHPRHPLQICSRKYGEDAVNCFWCNGYMGSVGSAFYRCSICDLNIHLFCASQQQLVLTLDAGTNHDHPLTIFPRKMYFACNLCGDFAEWFPIYACVQCDFMVHRGCLGLPNVIRISCHEHRISRRLHLPLREWLCGVCHLKIDSRYGAFFCTKSSDYAVHSNCGIMDSVWDQIELEHIPEDEDELEDVEAYEDIDGNHIKHFSHEHHLKFVSNQDGDKMRRCQACCLHILFDDSFYTCERCDDFVLHQDCAKFKRKIRHPLHLHPLTLKADDGMILDDDFTRTGRQGFYFCSMCGRFSRGFRYVCGKELGGLEICGKKLVRFEIDVRCASMAQKLKHKNHSHHLFVYLIDKNHPSCASCWKSSTYMFYCLKPECSGYGMCFYCATLPYEVVYKNDKHPLILCYGEESEEGRQYWCETCERKLDPRYWYYKCDHCCVTLHILCLLGTSPYAKPGYIMMKASRYSDEIDDSYLGRMEAMHIHTEEKYEIISNVTLSRPKCRHCNLRCQDSVAFNQGKDFYCSLFCLKKHKLYEDSDIFPHV